MSGHLQTPVSLRSWVFLAGLAIVVWGSAAMFSRSLSACVITEEHASELVMAELSRAGLDSRFLSAPTGVPNDCWIEFEYQGNGRRISYVVVDDPLRGPEVNAWDYAADANGP